MIERFDRRNAWVGLSPDLNFDCERTLVGHGTFQQERNGAPGISSKLCSLLLLLSALSNQLMSSLYGSVSF